MPASYSQKLAARLTLLDFKLHRSKYNNVDDVNENSYENDIKVIPTVTHGVQEFSYQNSLNSSIVQSCAHEIENKPL